MESYDGDSGDCVESIKILTTLYNFLDCHEATPLAMTILLLPSLRGFAKSRSNP